MRSTSLLNISSDLETLVLCGIFLMIIPLIVEGLKEIKRFFIWLPTIPEILRRKKDLKRRLSEWKKIESSEKILEERQARLTKARTLFRLRNINAKKIKKIRNPNFRYRAEIFNEN